MGMATVTLRRQQHLLWHRSLLREHGQTMQSGSWLGAYFISSSIDSRRQQRPVVSPRIAQRAPATVAALLLGKVLPHAVMAPPAALRTLAPPVQLLSTTAAVWGALLLSTSGLAATQAARGVKSSMRLPRHKATTPRLPLLISHGRLQVRSHGLPTPILGRAVIAEQAGASIIGPLATAMAVALRPCMGRVLPL